MANIAGTYNLTSYHPNVRWVVSYSETGRTTSSATYRFTVSMTLTTGQSYGYGYEVSLHLSQNGSTKATKQLKVASTGGTSWSTSFNATLSTDAAGGWISGIKIWSTSSNDSTHYQQALSVSGEVSKSSALSPPSAPTWFTASGTYTPGTSVKLSWGGASGTIGSYYIQYRQYDEVTGWTDWSYATWSNSTTGSHDIVSIGQNRTMLQYRVKATNDAGDSAYKESNYVYRNSVKVWNGSSFVNGTIKVWNGSSWVNGSIKVWNGSSWVNSK